MYFSMKSPFFTLLFNPFFSPFGDGAHVAMIPQMDLAFDGHKLL